MYFLFLIWIIYVIEQKPLQMLLNNKIKSKQFINLYTTIKGLEQDQFHLFLHPKANKNRASVVERCVSKEQSDWERNHTFTESLTIMHPQRCFCAEASQVIVTHIKNAGQDRMITA